MKNVVKIASVLFLTLVAVWSCKEKVLDSDAITIAAPSKGEVINGNDSVHIKAYIAVQESELVNWDITVQDKKGSDIYASIGTCDCKSQNQGIEVERAFGYDVTQSTEVKMTICAHYKNGEDACETTSFTIGK